VQHRARGNDDAAEEEGTCLTAWTGEAELDTAELVTAELDTEEVDMAEVDTTEIVTAELLTAEVDTAKQEKARRGCGPGRRRQRLMALF
jgi:H2-forming N5,N10-methylenetetrahydromethanopterin dehydrogenase-like enzyme